MSQAWVFLWLPLTAPSPTDQGHLERYARHEGISLTMAAPSPRAAPPPYPSAIVAHIERALETARVAFDTGDEDAARKELDGASGALRQHPELLQASWLMAEVFELEALAAQRRNDFSAARSLAASSAALAGPRALALSQGSAPAEVSAPEGGEPSTEPNASFASTAQLHTLQGLASGDVVYLDGLLFLAGDTPLPRTVTVTLPDGLHHVRVERAGQTWSAWLDVTKEVQPLVLTPKAPAPCSVEDLSEWGAANEPNGGSVRCPAWLAARPAEQGAIELATCHKHVCGPFRRFPAAAPQAAFDRPADEQRPSVAPWWGYAFLGTAVAATAGVLVWSATHSDESDRSVFVYGGVR